MRDAQICDSLDVQRRLEDETSNAVEISLRQEVRTEVPCVQSRDETHAVVPGDGRRHGLVVLHLDLNPGQDVVESFAQHLSELSLVAALGRLLLLLVCDHAESLPETLGGGDGALCDAIERQRQTSVVDTSSPRVVAIRDHRFK